MKSEKAKILIVEDEQIIGMHLSNVVKKLGYNVIGVISNGEDTLKSFDDIIPDVMLVDIGLKGQMNGIELVKQTKMLHDIPVIYLSSTNDDDQINAAEETLPIAYLQKPFDEKQLGITLKISLRRFLKQKEIVGSLKKTSEIQKINIQELSETNEHLITATWRERELKNELQKTKEIIEVQTKKIVDSINYAERIQTAIVPNENALATALGNSFLFYKPKDVVSGDFAWLYEIDDYIYFAAVDCTGHGVPGAMMSMIGNLLLNDIVKNGQHIKSPSEILMDLHKGVIKTLRQDDPENKTADGMDMALIKMKKDKSELVFSGAHLPLFLLRDKELIVYKGSRFPVGGMQYRNRNKYTDHIVEIQKGDKLYAFSDGIIDQIGGEENRKWMTVGLKEFIIENSQLSMTEFGIKVREKFESWMGKNKQIDDVIIVGVEI